MRSTSPKGAALGQPRAQPWERRRQQATRPEGPRSTLNPPAVPWAAVDTNDGRPRTIALCIADKQTQAKLAQRFTAAGWSVVEVPDPEQAATAALQHDLRYVLTDSTRAVSNVAGLHGLIPGTKCLCIVDGIKVRTAEAWEAGADMIVYPLGDGTDVMRFRVLRRS